MNIAINASSGNNIGLGHLKRCLGIAMELRNLRHRVEFLVNNENYSSLIHNSGFITINRIDPAKSYNMIIIDKYNMNEVTLTSYKKRCNLLVRIDDAAPVIVRDRVSDVLINGNPYANVNLYDGLVKQDCHLIVGPKFVPMDASFCHFRSRFRVKKSMKNIVISFGSSSKGMNYAYKVTKEILASNLSVNVFVVNGVRLQGNLNAMSNRQLKIKLLPFINNIGSIFVKADIALCSASTTSWQLAAIGTPFIAFRTADNQSLAFEYIKRSKIGMTVDDDSTSNGTVERELKRLNESKRQSYSEKSRRIIDGKGSRRIAMELNKLL